MWGCEVRSLCWVFRSFSKFNTREALNVYRAILIMSSGNSLSGTSALGVNSGAIASSLSLREVSCSPSLVYKTSIFGILQKHLHFKRLFSMVLATGISTRIRRKYIIDANCPIIIYGYSTGCPPIHVSVNRSATKIQNRHWLIGQNIMLHCLEVWSIGIRTRIMIESTKTRNPPSLLGIDRRIVYVNRKYHSGLI